MMHTGERRWGSRVLYTHSRPRYPHPRCSCVRQRHGIQLPMPYLSRRNGDRGPSNRACSVAPRVLLTCRPKRACPPSVNRDQTVHHTTPRNHAPPSRGTSVRNPGPLPLAPHLPAGRVMSWLAHRTAGSAGFLRSSRKFVAWTR